MILFDESDNLVQENIVHVTSASPVAGDVVSRQQGYMNYMWYTVRNENYKNKTHHKNTGLDDPFDKWLKATTGRLERNLKKKLYITGQIYVTDESEKQNFAQDDKGNLAETNEGYVIKYETTTLKQRLNDSNHLKNTMSVSLVATQKTLMVARALSLADILVTKYEIARERIVIVGWKDDPIGSKIKLGKKDGLGSFGNRFDPGYDTILEIK